MKKSFITSEPGLIVWNMNIQYDAAYGMSGFNIWLGISPQLYPLTQIALSFIGFYEGQTY